jgi:hypothetical protein
MRKSQIMRRKRRRKRRMKRLRAKRMRGPLLAPKSTRRSRE